LNLYEEEEVEKMMGVSKDTKAFGSINWPVFGGFLGIFSWHLPFAVYLFAIPLGLVALISVPEIYRKSKDTRKKDTELMREDYSLTGASAHEKYLLLAVYGLTFLANVFLFAILVFLPQLLEGTWISFPFFISLFFVVVMVSGAVASSKYQKIRSVLSNKVVILTALGLWAAGFAAISQTYSGLIILASVILFGIGEGLITPAVATWVDCKIPLSYGKVKSRMGTIRYLGQFSAPVVFFPVFVLEGLPGVFLAAAGVCAVLFLLFLAGGKE
jgi:MFS family permease